MKFLSTVQEDSPAFLLAAHPQEASTESPLKTEKCINQCKFTVVKRSVQCTLKATHLEADEPAGQSDAKVNRGRRRQSLTIASSVTL